jgi:BirA family transcriptional regulator, biotin operon repressor / biotin---[acetyl-CoA-carboxylase] ligase
MWTIYGFSKIRQLWLKKAYKIGEVVTITDIKNRISGVFETIDKDGAMKIKIASGEKYTMSTGEIFFG